MDHKVARLGLVGDTPEVEVDVTQVRVLAARIHRSMQAGVPVYGRSVRVDVGTHVATLGNDTNDRDVTAEAEHLTVVGRGHRDSDEHAGIPRDSNCVRERRVDSHTARGQIGVAFNQGRDDAETAGITAERERG